MSPPRHQPKQAGPYLPGRLSSASPPRPSSRLRPACVSTRRLSIGELTLDSLLPVLPGILFGSEGPIRPLGQLPVLSKCPLKGAGLRAWLDVECIGVVSVVAHSQPVEQLAGRFMAAPSVASRPANHRSGSQLQACRAPGEVASSLHLPLALTLLRARRPGGFGGRAISLLASRQGACRCPEPNARGGEDEKPPPGPQLCRNRLKSSAFSNRGGTRLLVQERGALARWFG